MVACAHVLLKFSTLVFPGVVSGCSTCLFQGLCQLESFQGAFTRFWTVNYLIQWLTIYTVLHVLLQGNIYKSISVLFGHLHLSDTERFMVTKWRELLPDQNLKNILSNPKEKKNCIWRATESSGWSRPAWDTCDRDDVRTGDASALEQSQAQLRCFTSASRSIWTFGGWNTSPEAGEISSLGLTASHECDSKSKQQKDFMISEQK